MKNKALDLGVLIVSSVLLGAGLTALTLKNNNKCLNTHHEEYINKLEKENITLSKIVEDKIDEN